MRTERVTGFEDPRVRAYRNLPDAALRAGRTSPQTPHLPDTDPLFIAEGEVVVRQLIESGYRVRSVLLTPARLGTVGDALERLPESTHVYIAEQGVMDRIVGFHIHRGLLAAGERGAERSVAEVLDAAPVGAPLVVLEDLANHDNIGGVFRCAAALGAGAVVLSPRCADPLYRKALRVSAGAALRVPFARASRWPEAIGELRERGYVVCALTPEREAVPIGDFVSGLVRGQRVALLLGAEGPGLSGGALSAADARVRIPIREGNDSLNVTVAAGIALHAIRGAV